MADLTTVARVKEWVGIPADKTESEPLIARLISAVSRAILNYLNRPNLAKATYVRSFSGVGNTSVMLKDFPVTSINALMVGGVNIPAAVNQTSLGYVFPAWDGYCPGGSQLLMLRGYSFPVGQLNATIEYVAGYFVEAEEHRIPDVTEFDVAVDAEQGKWSSDLGVVYEADGAAFIKVDEDPDEGEYSVEDGVYTFNELDADVLVLISYNYVPADIENACIEIVGERFRAKDRIGVNSKTLAGQETISYTTADMNRFTRMALDPYKRVVLG